jgi:hypothetical protein
MTGRSESRPFLSYTPGSIKTLTPTRSRVQPQADHIAHQLRVHLQYLGYPIANDPLYSGRNIWGPNLGKNGVDLVAQPAAPAVPLKVELRIAAHPRAIFSDADRLKGEEAIPEGGSLSVAVRARMEDRELANIDLTSPILLSQQAREIIGKLRRLKDEQEDWVK